jgi:hypothetical protein
MALPSGVIGPIVGALISGIIGVLIVEYRNYRDEVAEIRRWYDQSIRLADQLERETPESYLKQVRGEGEASERGETADDMIDAYDRIGERLRDHINRAPPEITESVIDSATLTARYCQIVAREGRDSGFISRVGPAVKSAKNLKEEAREAKQEVGFV